MRRAIRLATLLLALLPATSGLGCFVLDELDAGNAILDQHGGRGSASASTPEAEDAEAPPTPEERRQAWWSGASTPEASGDADPVVGCAIRGRTQFVRRSDCTVRGGREQ